VLVEHANGRPDDVSLQAATLASGYARAAGVPLHAVLIGEGGQAAAAGLGGFGIELAHAAEHDGFSAYAPAAWAATLQQLADGAIAVIAPGSERGNEVLAHLAARLDLPLAANCTEAAPGDPATVTRVRWGGSLLEEAAVHAPLVLLTVMPHAVAVAAGGTGAAAVEPFQPQLEPADLVVAVAERVVADTGGGVSLADAKVVVSGGRGTGSAEGFAAIEELAALLGGAVGCSRAVTIAGWRPHTDQVGQTGTKIAPEIYIACGISGATQHMAGCKGAKRILAINTDPEASIIASADYAVIGDLHEVVPAIVAALRGEG
jgi:electron transfer flavoprotein alpha subunit